MQHGESGSASSFVRTFGPWARGYIVHADAASRKPLDIHVLLDLLSLMAWPLLRCARRIVLLFRGPSPQSWAPLLLTIVYNRALPRPAAVLAGWRRGIAPSVCALFRPRACSCHGEIGTSGSLLDASSAGPSRRDVFDPYAVASTRPDEQVAYRPNRLLDPDLPAPCRALCPWIPPAPVNVTSNTSATDLERPRCVCCPNFLIKVGRRCPRHDLALGLPQGASPSLRAGRQGDQFRRL